MSGGEGAVLARTRVPMCPPSGLAPNRVRHLTGWERQALVAELRGATARAARPAAPAVPVAGPYALDVTIGWGKGRRRLDFDSAVGSVKAVGDGLIDAGWARSDSQLVAMRVEQVRDPSGVGYVDVVMRMEA